MAYKKIDSCNSLDLLLYIKSDRAEQDKPDDFRFQHLLSRQFRI